MVKAAIILFLTCIYSKLLIAQSDLSNIKTLDTLDKIPIFSKIDIKTKDTSQFDSKEGKILIINFQMKQKYEQEMKDFY